MLQGRWFLVHSVLYSTYHVIMTRQEERCNIICASRTMILWGKPWEPLSPKTFWGLKAQMKCWWGCRPRVFPRDSQSKGCKNITSISCPVKFLWFSHITMKYRSNQFDFKVLWIQHGFTNQLIDHWKLQSVRFLY